MAEENPLNLTFERRLLNKRRYMEKLKYPRLAVLDDIICFCIPELEKMDINSVDQKGGHAPGRRYNGYAMLALDLYASGWFGYCISPALDWFRIVDSDPELMMNEEVAAWLDIVENRFYTIFENSNFYEVEALKLRYSPTMGWSSSYLEEDPSNGRYVFKVFHPGKVLLFENHFGEADTTLIVDKIPVGDAIARFGEKSLSRNLINEARSDEYKEWEFCHFVEPNPERDNRSILNTRMPYRSVYWQSNAELEKDGIKIVRTSGYKMNPYINWRMRKGTTAYGYGLAEAALVDIAQSNALTKDLLMASNRSADPAYNVPVEQQGMVDLRPHAINYYEDPNRVITPLITGINYQIGNEERAEIKEAINKHFHVDFFALLANMEGPSKTATEVIEIAGEKAAIISMPIMKYNYENLERQFKQIYVLERRAGRIPPPPAVYGNREPIPDFIGPLAQAQRKLFQGRGIQSAIELSSPIWQLRPETMDQVNFDMVQKYIFDTTNFPVKAINKNDDVMAMRQNRQRMQEQQMKEQSMMNESAAALNMAKADKNSGGKMSKAMEEQQ